MNEGPFDAAKFVREMTAGRYDVDIHAELERLSQDDLEQVANVLIRESDPPRPLPHSEAPSLIRKRLKEREAHRREKVPH